MMSFPAMDQVCVLLSHSMMLKSPVRNLRGQKNPTMLRVGVAQAGCDPRVILTA
jgi:hypothetical protein